MFCRRAFTVTKTKIPSAGRDIRILILQPTAAAKPAGSTPGILWIHGGGYATGMAGMVYMSRARNLVRKYGAVVISPAYRLSGEKPYPAALEDCYAALTYLKTHAAALGCNPNQLMVGGESAGGGLAAALCMYARDRGEVRIAFQMPLYPMLDDRDTDSSRSNHGISWNTARNHRAWKAYLAEVAGEPPAYAAPARQTDYRNLPPAYTFVGDREPFFCETLAYVARLREAGVPAQADVYPTGFHAFDMLLPFRKISKQAAAAFEQHYLRAAAHCFAKQEESV